MSHPVVLTVVKSVCVQTGARGWRGAACQSLLYGVCQYQVSPSSLLASPRYTITPLHRGLRLSWACQHCQGWLPSSLSITLCLARRLEDRQPVSEQDCHQVTSEEDQSLDIVGLHTFAEYKLEVTSFLEFFNLTASQTVIGRTCEFTLIFRQKNTRYFQCLRDPCCGG